MIDYHSLINKVSHNHEAILTLFMGSLAPFLKNLLTLNQVISFRILLDPHDTAKKRFRAGLKNREK